MCCKHREPSSVVNVVEFSEQGSLLIGQVFEKQAEFLLVALDLFRAHLRREFLVEEVAQLGQQPQEVDGPENLGRKSVAFKEFLELNVRQILSIELR